MKIAMRISQISRNSNFHFALAYLRLAGRRTDPHPDEAFNDDYYSKKMHRLYDPLIHLGLVETVENDGVRYYCLTEAGEEALSIVEKHKVYIVSLD
jgi:hypothetical protein